MNRRILLLSAVALLVLLLAIPGTTQAQGGRGGGGARGGPPPTAQATAPIDLTGYWVALVTEDWRWRMVTPKKGDYPSIPLNAAGQAIAGRANQPGGWDPAKDEAAGEQCKGYGAGNIMRLPGRFHITWDGPNTLKVEVDNGMQTRLIQFGAPASAATATKPAEKTWQGTSVGTWEAAGGRGSRGGDLKVVTTGMRPGYLQKNGVPYSADAVFTEYFHKFDEPGGGALLVVSTLTEDPTYLQGGTHIRSSHYKKLPDATGWNPTPCTAR
jgi:hypothetical protein